MSTIRQQDFDPGQQGGRRVGVGVVVGIHIIVGWGLASGLGNEMVAAVKKPLQAVVLQEVVLPPPPPPPPKPQQPPKQVVQEAAPPPPFVPPAEVRAQPAVEAPVVQSSITPPPAPAPIAPPAPSAPARMDLTIACPTQAKPQVPERALREGLSGTVRAQATITGGVVSAVDILSGPRVFHAAVREAMQKYRCTAPDGTVAMQAFDFRVE